MNKNLIKAKAAKNDEFYTQYCDIEKECKHYIKHFKNKWIYMPCDTEESNFWKYFVDHFKEYSIKHLTATHINLDGTSSYRLDYNGTETLKTALKGNGDFRSEECTKIKDECDIVITNPPFSLFRNFIKWLQDKKFLIIGNMNAITYKEIFPLIKDDKIWLGQNAKGGTRKGDSLSFTNENGEIKDISSWWYTNIDCVRHNTFIDLYKHYNKEEYPKYDNYDAINVNKISDIPMDYDGVIGVPITFIGQYCPEQFEIIKFRKGDDEKDLSINGKCPYFRILIKRKTCITN